MSSVAAEKSSAAAENGPIIIRRSSRWTWAFLILSLSINLLIVGIVIGSVWAIRKGGFWDAPVAFERNQRFMGRLPEERRVEIRRIFFDHKPAMSPYWRDVREARVKIGHLIENGGYTMDELKVAMDELFQKELTARQAAKSMIAEMIAKLTPSERLHFLRVFLPYLDVVHGCPAPGPGG